MGDSPGRAPEPRARGVSLWLVPEREAARAIGRLIAALAQRLGTPPFDAHITLLAGLTRPAEEVARRAERVAAAIEGPLTLSLLPPEGREEPFRCLYVPVGPTSDLLAALALARATLGARPKEPFDPHLSLVYGRLEPSRQLALASEIAADLPVRMRFNRLDVVRTSGPVSRWSRIARFRLGSPARRGRASKPTFGRREE